MVFCRYYYPSLLCKDHQLVWCFDIGLIEAGEDEACFIAFEMGVKIFFTVFGVFEIVHALVVLDVFCYVAQGEFVVFAWMEVFERKIYSVSFKDILFWGDFITIDYY